MNLFGFSLTRSSPKQNPQIEIQKSLSPEMLAWLGNDPAPSAPTLIDPYQQISWVYSAINAIAQQVANIPFVFSRGVRGRETLITSGPLVDFYDRPHPSINRYQYWEQRIIWLMLRGECFRIPIYEEDSSGASPIRIRKPKFKIGFIDPTYMHEIIENHHLVGWRYTGPSTYSQLPSQVFLPEEVWLDKLFNPLLPFRGLSPLQAAAVATRTDFAAASFMGGLMANNADNGLIVRTASNLQDLQREQIRAALQNRKRGPGVADRPLILSDAIEIVQPKLSSADLQFLENRKFSRSEICAVFGIPEEIITATEHAKYDVMQGARLNFIENRIAPLCARLEADEQATIKLIDPTAVGWFDIDSIPIMQAARRQRLAAAKAGFDIGIPFNELNQAFDLGFKSLPHGANCYLPANLHKVGTLPKEEPKQVKADDHAKTESVLAVARQLNELFAPLKAKTATSTPHINSDQANINRPALLALAQQIKEALDSADGPTTPNFPEHPQQSFASVQPAPDQTPPPPAATKSPERERRSI